MIEATAFLLLLAYMISFLFTAFVTKAYVKGRREVSTEIPESYFNILTFVFATLSFVPIVNTIFAILILRDIKKSRSN